MKMLHISINVTDHGMEGGGFDPPQQHCFIFRIKVPRGPSTEYQQYDFRYRKIRLTQQKVIYYYARQLVSTHLWVIIRTAIK
jgi:hypothetical protein